MTRPASYSSGSFNWVDLRTTDLEAAKDFYAELFGWTYAVMDPSGGDYNVALLEDDPVAGLKVLSEGQAGGGDSPFWLNYVAVDSVDDAVTRTRELGGTVRAGPFDRGTSRLAVILDLFGGKLCLWQSPGQAGACRIAEPGCLTWHELLCTDAQAAGEFYAGLLGWRIERTGIAVGRRCGVRDLADEREGERAQWHPHFAVAGLEDALTRVLEVGGQVLSGPTNGPAGRFAMVSDPQGARFALAADSRAR